MSLLALEIPEETRRELDQIADLTDIRDSDRHATVIAHALRVYSWVLDQQARGRTIVAIGGPDDPPLPLARYVRP